MRVTLLCLLLTGCATERVVMKPQEPIVVERIVYVKVDAALTQPEPIASGKPSQVFEVAAQRKAAAEKANAKLKAISKIEGTDVDPARPD